MRRPSPSSRGGCTLAHAMNQKGYDDLPADALEALDTFIFDRSILRGMQLIRERLGCSLAQAQVATITDTQILWSA